MTGSLTPRILSRPSPWLTAAILLLIAALVTLFGGRTTASAYNVSDEFSPTSTSAHSAPCYEWEATKQSYGGPVARCEGPSAGEVVYQFDPTGIPANATNIKYSAYFFGTSGGGPGQIELFITAAGAAFGPSNVIGLTTTESTKTTNNQTWGVNWTPSTNAQVKMKRLSGEKVFWDGLKLVVSYELPDHANLSVSASGPVSALQGEGVDFLVTVSNSGPQTAQSVVLTTSLPAGIVNLFVSGCVSGGVPNCNLGNIAAGGSKTVTFHTLAALNAVGNKSALFEATSATADTNPNNNDDSHTVLIYARRNYTICKTWEDNNDGTLEPARAFTIRIHHSGGKPPVDLQRTVSEGNTVCGAGFTYNEALTVEELPAAGFASDPAYPTWAFEGGPSGQGSGPVAMPLGLEKLTFTNRTAVAGEPQPQGSAKFIALCKTVLDNGDGIDDTGYFEFSIGVVGNQPFAYRTMTVIEGGPAECAKLYPADYGISESSQFEIEEMTLPAGWVHAPLYPQWFEGQLVHVSTVAQFTIPAGEDGYAVGFYNMHAPKKSLVVCKTLIDNADGVDDSGTFAFTFSVVGQPPFATRSLTLVEGGNGDCAKLYPADYGVADTSQFAIEESTFPAGWTNAQLYPQWLEGNLVHLSAVAQFTIPAQEVGWAVGFFNKHAAAANPTPTATPATPTSTPATPGNTPVPPTNTPVPPTATPTWPIPQYTPEPPQPTSTPVPPSNPGNPGAPGGASNPTPQVPSGSTPPTGGTSSGTTPTGNAPAPQTNDGGQAPTSAQPTPIAPNTGATASAAASGTNSGSAMVLGGLAAICAAAGLVNLKRKAVTSR